MCFAWSSLSISPYENVKFQNFTGDKDVFFCGVFDGHGPCGHEVAQEVRDMLPSKLSDAHKYLQTNGRSQSDIDGYYDDEDNQDLNLVNPNDNGPPDPKDPEANKLFHCWRASFLRSFREVDRELYFESSVDSFCSGTTAVTVVKQVWPHVKLVTMLFDSILCCLM